MGRAPCCDKSGLKKGPWTPEEDHKLIDYIKKHGYGNWRTLPKNAGLERCGKSCRLRWTNYLRPDIKRGRFTFEEEEAIIQLHSILGNKWSAIASRLPGRTDNEIKNYWNTHIRKRLLRIGIDPVTHSPRLDLLDLSSILNSSFYDSSQMNIQRLLGMQPMVNPELLKLASSLFSHQSQYPINMECAQNGDQENQFCSTQFQNQIPHFQDTPCVSMPFTHSQLVESNVNQYQSDFNDFSSSQQHSHMSDWHSNEIASRTAITEDYVPQLPSYNYHGSNYLTNIMDYPLVSETSTFFSNNSNQNFSLASVLSTPSSSPKELNSNSTYINGSSTEDERECYVSSNILGYEIRDILGVNEIM
ncbi:unnamed protein product [Lupinus luteus]|uniref:Uncharacterized protein n=1 Tax=Lupinus luteus TaxID=3873 RepID=A0AAV1YBZ0_LUPLU